MHRTEKYLTHFTLFTIIINDRNIEFVEDFNAFLEGLNVIINSPLMNRKPELLNQNHMFLRETRNIKHT